MGLGKSKLRDERSVDERARIQERLTGWKQAMESKDAAAVAKCYTDDAVIFGLAPPLSTSGMNQQALQAWFDTWQGPIAYEMRDLKLIVGDELAYCVSLTRLKGTKTSGEKNDLWFRASVCLRRIDGDWRVTHEHTSVPFKMDGSLQAAVDLEP